MTAQAWGRIAFRLVVCAVLYAARLGAETIDPSNDGSQHAWAENAGWLNAEPGGDGGPGMDVRPGDVRGWAWLENVGWVSLWCGNTGSCQSTSYGVSFDPLGDLSGWAWSENAGWISFACENTASCGTVDYGVTVDLTTGELGGWAWSENLGWLSASCTNTGTCGTVGYGIRTEPSVLGVDIFSDGFETGGTSAWDTTVQ